MLGVGFSYIVSPAFQVLTPRYRYVWAEVPRHEICLDLLSRYRKAVPSCP